MLASILSSLGAFRSAQYPVNESSKRTVLVLVQHWSVTKIPLIVPVEDRGILVSVKLSIPLPESNQAPGEGYDFGGSEEDPRWLFNAAEKRSEKEDPDGHTQAMSDRKGKKPDPHFTNSSHSETSSFHTRKPVTHHEKSGKDGKEKISQLSFEGAAGPRDPQHKEKERDGRLDDDVTGKDKRRKISQSIKDISLDDSSKEVGFLHPDKGASRHNPRKKCINKKTFFPISPKVSQNSSAAKHIAPEHGSAAHSCKGKLKQADSYDSIIQRHEESKLRDLSYQSIEQQRDH